MSTYVLMKILESSPDRYDKGINLLSFGKLDGIYNRLLSGVKNGQHVLDIGCGTGALSIKAATLGANVTGIDINAQMLDIARKNAREQKTESRINFIEMGIAELERIESGTYDVVVSGLCFSELSDDELRFTLIQVKRILKENGFLLVADETLATTFILKTLNLILRIPLKIITYILTQSGTNAVNNLPRKVEEAGLKTESVRTNKMQNFIELVAVKQKEIRT